VLAHKGHALVLSTPHECAVLVQTAARQVINRIARQPLPNAIILLEVVFVQEVTLLMVVAP